MFQEALKILKDSSKSTSIVSRDTVIFSNLLQKLNNPQKDFKSIHITGTNGKGSVTLKTATVLQQAGYKVGMYTSPHIFSFLERIQINRTQINNRFFSQKILMINEIAKSNNFQLTFFEYLTATGFLYFKEQKCDFAAIEVGLGGRFDTTNVIDPVLSVITSIGIDHEKLLGNTRQKIAYDKAGIIKNNKPVVIGPNANLKPIIDEADLKQSKLFLVQGVNQNDFQIQNCNIVRENIKVLRELGYKISDDALIGGLKAKQPCRMQQLPLNLYPNWIKGKKIFFDVGHNPDAIKRMLQYYKLNIKKDQKSKLCIIFGSSKQKNINQSLSILEKQATNIFLVEAKHDRAMSISELMQYVGMSERPSIFGILKQGDIETTVTFVGSNKRYQTVIICGSFFMMPQAWSVFDKKYKNLQTNVQEGYQMKNKNK